MLRRRKERRERIKKKEKKKKYVIFTRTQAISVSYPSDTIKKYVILIEDDHRTRTTFVLYDS